MRGPRIRVELDDHLLYDCTDNFTQKGSVALRCFNSAGRFRNIRVTAPDGTVLWEGLPDLPDPSITVDRDGKNAEHDLSKGVEKVPGTLPGATKSIEGKPPGPLATRAADSPVRRPSDKPQVPLIAHLQVRADTTAPTKEITNTIGMKLVLIPSGEFLMGSPDSDKDARDNEKPQHHVQITRPFYLGIHEVTQGQYRAVTGENPPRFKGSSDDLPVNWVSWNEAIAFCDKLSKRDGMKPYHHFGGSVQRLGGEAYRLPTEAEWEYACRAGSTTRYNFGDDAVSLNEFAWVRGNSGGRSHPVGQKRPNAWGLYDMHGNLWEWCEDWYDEMYYQHSPGADPLGPSRAASRVFRGECWLDPPPACRSAFRVGLAPGMRANYLGFRVARLRRE